MAYFSTSDEYKLYFDEYGSRENPTVIFTYDIGGKRSFFARQASGLCDRYHIVTWDYRGNGSADKRHTQLNPERLAEDLNELITILGKDKVILAGTGFGCAIILNFIKKYGGDRIGKLIFMDASLKEIAEDDWKGYSLKDKKAAIDFMKEMTYDWETFNPQLLDQMFGSAEISDEDKAAITAKFNQNDNRMMMPLMAVYICEDSIETASSLTVPVLLTYGKDRDEAYLAKQEAVSAVFKGAVRKAFAGGTLHFFIDSDNFNKAVKEFIG